MQANRSFVAAAQLLVVALAFFVGRWSAPSPVASRDVEPSRQAASASGPSVSPRVGGAAAATATPSTRAEATAADAPRGGGSDSDRATEASGVPRTMELSTCKAELVRIEGQLSELEREKKAMHGEPIAPRTNVAARFGEKPLLSAMQGAFKATGIAGRIDTVDCTEFPCIVFGRVNGDEEMVAKLEDAKPLEVYDQDIGVMLTWSSGDQSLGHGASKTQQRQKPQEVSLFAFAFYTAGDKAQYGDSLDRRIRSRTADLWNALRPDDQ